MPLSFIQLPIKAQYPVLDKTANLFGYPLPNSLLTKRTAADRAPPQRTETRSVSRSFRKTHRNPKRPFQYYSRSLPPTMGTPDGRISMTEHCGGASKCWKGWGWETHRILPKAEMGNFFDYKLEEFPAWFLLIQ